MAPNQKRITPAPPNPRVERKAPASPLEEGLLKPYAPSMTCKECDVPLGLTSDSQTPLAFFRMGRMGMDNFDSLGEYVVSLTELFENCRRCTVFFSPSDIFDTMKTNLEHRLTIRRGGGTITVDESGHDSWGGPFDPILTAFMNRTPVLIDRNPGQGFSHGLRLTFDDLDRNSDRGIVESVELDRDRGMRAIMPFYYREHSPSARPPVRLDYEPAAQARLRNRPEGGHPGAHQEEEREPAPHVHRP